MLAKIRQRVSHVIPKILEMLFSVCFPLQNVIQITVMHVHTWLDAASRKINKECKCVSEVIF